MRACSIDEVVQLVNEASEVILAYRILARDGRLCTRRARSVSIEPSQLVSGIDAVVVKDELLFHVGVANQRDIIEGLKFAAAVRCVRALWTFAMPIRLRWEGATILFPFIMRTQQIESLVVRLVVCRQIESWEVLIGEIEPPDPSMTVNERGTTFSVTVALRLQHSCRVRERNAVPDYRWRTARTDRVGVIRFARQQMRERTFEHASCAGVFDYLVVLDEQRRIDESLILTSDAHQHVRYRASATDDVTSKSRLQDKFGAFDHERRGVLGARGKVRRWVKQRDLFEGRATMFVGVTLASSNLA